MGLTDAIDAPDALLNLHRVPRQVVIEHDMAELQVQTLAAGVGGDQHLSLVREGALHLLTLVEIERAVEADHLEAAIAQELRQHGLRRDKLGEHQHLELRVVLLTLQFVDPVEQHLGLSVGALGFTPPCSREQKFHFGALVLEPLHSAAEHGLHLLLRVEVRPLFAHIFTEEVELPRG